MSEPESKADGVRLTAWVHGRVQVVAQGSRDACERLLRLLQDGKTPGHIDNVVVDWSPRGEPISGFTER